jgi:hypothetical protein
MYGGAERGQAGSERQAKAASVVTTVSEMSRQRQSMTLGTRGGGAGGQVSQPGLAPGWPPETNGRAVARGGGVASLQQQRCVCPVAANCPISVADLASREDLFLSPPVGIRLSCLSCPMPAQPTAGQFKTSCCVQWGMGRVRGMRSRAAAKSGGGADIPVISVGYSNRRPKAEQPRGAVDARSGGWWAVGRG